MHKVTPIIHLHADLARIVYTDIPADVATEGYTACALLFNGESELTPTITVFLPYGARIEAKP